MEPTGQASCVRICPMSLNCPVFLLRRTFLSKSFTLTTLRFSVASEQLHLGSEAWEAYLVLVQAKGWSPGWVALRGGHPRVRVHLPGVLQSRAVWLVGVRCQLGESATWRNHCSPALQPPSVTLPLGLLSVSLQGLLFLSWRGPPKQTRSWPAQRLARRRHVPAAQGRAWPSVVWLSLLCAGSGQVWFCDFRRLGVAGLAAWPGLWATCTFLPLSEGGLILGFVCPGDLDCEGMRTELQGVFRSLGPPCLEVWGPRCLVSDVQWGDVSLIFFQLV